MPNGKTSNCCQHIGNCILCDRDFLHRQEVEKLSEQEKRIMDSLLNAVRVLPDGKREYLLGFAEGVEAMSPAQHRSEPQNSSTETK